MEEIWQKYLFLPFFFMYNSGIILLKIDTQALPAGRAGERVREKTT
jgi:hypothetical protein